MTRWPARRPLDVVVPEELVRFVPTEWVGDLWEAFAAWKRARRAWMAATYPRGGIGPLGDGIDMLVFEREVRRRFPPGPLRPGEHWTSGPPG